MGWDWLSKNRESINSWTDTVSHVATVIALIVGGVWTYMLFVKKDAPALEYRGKLNTDIQWTASHEKDYCWGTLQATVKNEGLSSFDVTDVLIRGWYYTIKTSAAKDENSLPAPGAKRPTMIDDQQIMSREPDFSRSYDSENSKLPGGDILPGLLTHYPPGGEAHQDTSFVFERDPTSGVILKVDVTTGGKHSQQFVSGAFTGDQICGELKEEEPKISGK